MIESEKRIQDAAARGAALGCCYLILTLTFAGFFGLFVAHHVGGNGRLAAPIAMLISVMLLVGYLKREPKDLHKPDIHDPIDSQE